MINNMIHLFHCFVIESYLMQMLDLRPLEEAAS